MNDPVLRGFERLAAKAREERPLQIDVAARVVRSLNQQRTARPVDRDTVRFCIGCLIAAALVMVTSVSLEADSSDDSLLALVQPFVSVMP